MMEAAVEASKDFPNLKVLALTVVTGLNDQDLVDIGFSDTCEDLVVRLAKLADASGCHGVITSPHEVEKLKGILNTRMLLITPGIRPNESPIDDQFRVGTPKQAITAGASYIVVGRPIIRAKNPAQAARQILDEINS